MRNMLRSTSILLVCAVASQAFAQEVEQSEDIKEFIEPITIEETIPNEVGEWAVRFSIEYPMAGSERGVFLPRLQSFYGAFKNVGLEVDFPLIYRTQQSRTYGFGPISSSVKWLLVQPGDPNPAVALGFEVGIPGGSSDDESEERSYEYGTFVALLKQVGNIILQGNLGLSREVSVVEEEAAMLFHYSLAVALPVVQSKLHLMIETTSSRTFDGGGQTTVISPGLKFNVSEGVFVAFAVSLGVGTSSDTQFGITQLQLWL